MCGWTDEMLKCLLNKWSNMIKVKEKRDRDSDNSCWAREIHCPASFYWETNQATV